LKLAAERLDTVPVAQRGWEWRYLKRQLHGGIFTLYGHTGRVTSAAFSPDGTRIVTGAAKLSGPFEVKVWDARTGICLFDLKGLPPAPRMAGVAFSADSKRIVTAGGDKTVRVWDATTGALQLELTEHAAEWDLNNPAFSPDGTQIAASYSAGDGGLVKVWDARTGKALREWKAHQYYVTRVAFSPDGTRILTGSRDESVKVWDARTAALLLDAKGMTRSSVAFSPDGKRIVASHEGGTARVIDARTGGVLLELKGRPLRLGQVMLRTGVLTVAFSPDGTRIVTGGTTGSDRLAEASVWDARTGAELLELKGHTAPVTSASFSPDGTRIITASEDRTAKVWDARTGTPRLELEGIKGPIVHASFSPDGTWMVTGEGSLRDAGEATVWDARTGMPRFTLKGHVNSVAVSQDGTRIATGSGELQKRGAATVWDARTGQPLLKLKGLQQLVNSLAFSPDGERIITGGKPGADRSGATPPYEVKVWDARTAALLLDLTQPYRPRGGMTGAPVTVAFSPDGKRVIIAGALTPTNRGDGVTVRDARTGAALLELEGNHGAVMSAAFSPDGARIATGYFNKTATVWDPEKGTPLLDLKGHTSYVKGVAFSPDGKRIVTGSGDRTVRVWDARTGTTLVELKGHTDPVTSVSFSADGTRLLTAGGSGVFVWDAPTHIREVPDEEEIAYRRLHMEPDLRRYRAGYLAARAAKDDFAAGFYLKLLPLPERTVLETQAAADREIAAGRTQDAIVHLVILSAAKPKDSILLQKVAALQAWFGRDKEFADTCGRAYESAKGTSDPTTMERMAKIYCLRSTQDKARREAALALARKAVELGNNHPSLLHLALGMAEYRSGHFAEADAALIAAARLRESNPHVSGTTAFYRAMSLFRQGKGAEARQLATSAAAQMRPLPADENNPLAGGADADDLILWLAYKEAKAMLKFDAAPSPEKK
jgi:WD40 repeat protein